MIVKKVCAKVDLVGNPPGLFYGKVISACISNFHAKVTLTESQQLKIEPHRVFDPTEFPSLRELEATSKRDGYYGGIRLIYATCKLFSEYCREHNLMLDDRNYTIRYDTDIPRQVGLGGSSAIVVALLKALMEFYGLTDGDIPLEIQSNLVFSVETDELGINTGLQDGVSQICGGTMYMDFDKWVMDRLGYGMYGYLDFDTFPNLFLAYMKGSNKDSGRIHDQIRFRFTQGDKEIVDAMATFASYALEARQVLLRGDLRRFGELMNMNFDLHRKIYGDSAIGERSLRMIEIARSHDAPAKFPGLGGAVIGIYEGGEQYTRLEETYTSNGFEFEEVFVNLR